jgi:hypothetical protein
MRNTILVPLLAMLALAADPIGRAQAPTPGQTNQPPAAGRGRGAPPAPVFRRSHSVAFVRSITSLSGAMSAAICEQSGLGAAGDASHCSASASKGNENRGSL